MGLGAAATVWGRTSPPHGRPMWKRNGRVAQKLFKHIGGRRCYWPQLATQTDWNAATVESTTKVGEDRYKLLVNVRDEVSRGYTVAGQFVQVRVDEDKKPAFIALANKPNMDTPHFEMIIKTNDGTAGDICSLKEGQELELSAVMGKGFRVEERAPAKLCPRVVLFATGTGIAPIKALIDSGELDIAKRENVELYYGYKNENFCAYEEEFDNWVGLNIQM